MEEQINWSVEFYRDARGGVPVQEFLEELPKKERAQMLRVINLLAEFGNQLGLPHTRPMNKGSGNCKPDQVACSMLPM